MSLQVWLPLNGDLKNQGLADITITKGSAVTVVDNGKIGGKTYSFNGNTNSYLRFPSPFSTSLTSFSVAGWVSLNSGYAANNGIHILSFNTSSSYARICISKDSAAVTVLLNSPNTKITSTMSASALTADVWHHYVVTYKSGLVKIYIDGILDKTQSTSVTTFTVSNSYTIGTHASETANAKLNDFRLYDHELSAKEVKELSKALVLHMPFKDAGVVPYNQNMLPDSNVNSLSKYLGTQARYYENTSQTSYTNTWIAIDDPPVPGILNGIQQKVTAQEGFHSVTWYQSGTISVSAIPYTMSVYVKRISGTDLIFKFQYGKSPYVASTVQIANDDEWHQYSWTFVPNTASSQAAASGTTRIYCGGLYSVGEVQICGWKLEKGTVATPWNEYGNLFYDCSGYGHYGLGMGTLTALTISPRFNKGIKFDNANKHIVIPTLPTAGFGDSYTFAWWGTRSAQNVMYWGYADGIRLNGMYNGIYWNTGDGSENPLYKPGTTTAVTAPALNTWAHWVMTGDGTKCRVYQNGVLWAEAKTYKSISGTLLIINGWNTLANYSSSNLSIADFRIYATALSAEDVKELYESSAAIDNKANGYAREFVEQDDTLSINKAGQFITNEILENTATTTAQLTKTDKQLKVNNLYEY